MSDRKGRTFENEAYELHTNYEEYEKQSVHNLSTPAHSSRKLMLATCISVGILVGIGLGMGISIVMENFGFPLGQSCLPKASEEINTQGSTVHSHHGEPSTVGNFEEASTTPAWCPDLLADKSVLNETLENCTISLAEQSRMTGVCENEKLKLLEQEMKFKDFKELTEKEREESLRVKENCTNSLTELSKLTSDCEKEKTAKLLEQETKIKQIRELAEKERTESARTKGETEALKVAQTADRATIAELTTFQATFSGINRLTGWAKSRPYHVYAVPWKITINPHLGGQKHLGIHLRCNDEAVSQTWFYRAKFVLKLLSHRPDVKPLSMEADYCNYTKGSENWGWNEFIKWTDLMDPLKGYVKDNSITVEARVTPETPRAVVSV